VGGSIFGNSSAETCLGIAETLSTNPVTLLNTYGSPRELTWFNTKPVRTLFSGYLSDGDAIGGQGVMHLYPNEREKNGV
jgi:hypothetical protein